MTRMIWTPGSFTGKHSGKLGKSFIKQRRRDPLEMTTGILLVDISIIVVFVVAALMRSC